MRKRINRNALCSSYKYETSKKLHLEYLKEKHAHFCGLYISGEISIDTPVVQNNTITPKFKTIKVFGKKMQVTIEEYNVHCKKFKL